MKHEYHEGPKAGENYKNFVVGQLHVHAAVHPAYECLLKEGREPRAQCWLSFLFTTTSAGNSPLDALDRVRYRTLRRSAMFPIPKRRRRAFLLALRYRILFREWTESALSLFKRLVQVWKDKAMHFSGWHKVFFVIKIGVSVACLWFWFHLPSPEWAAALIGAVAAAMSLHRDMANWQRAYWMILICALLIIEFKSISRDRTTQQNQNTVQQQQFKDIQDKQNKEFEATAKNIEQTTKGFHAMLSQAQNSIQQEQLNFRQTTKDFKNVVNTETGGDSFCYLWFIADNGFWDIGVQKVGKYPIRDLYVELTDLTYRQEYQDEYAKSHHLDMNNFDTLMSHEFRSAVDSNSSHLYYVGSFLDNSHNLGEWVHMGSERQDFLITFVAANGVWSERFIAKVVNNHWERAVSVTGGPNSPLKHYVYVSARYPLVNGDVPEWATGSDSLKTITKLSVGQDSITGEKK